MIDDFNSTNPSHIQNKVIDSIRLSGIDVSFRGVEKLEEGECIDDAKGGYRINLNAKNEEDVRNLALDAFGENEYDSGKYDEYCWVIGSNSISVFTF